jgi:hypothetical protein
MASIELTEDRAGKIRTFVRNMIDMADRAQSARVSQWQRVEKRYRAFVDVTETNRQSGARTYPWDETVIIPYSYAIVQTITAYRYTLFTAQVPLMQVEDPTGEKQEAADLAELVLEHYNRLQRANLILYGLLLDAAKYGVGVGKCVWETRKEMRYRTVTTPVELLGMPLGLTTQKVKELVTVYDGPRTTLVDPWLFLPDPRVPLWQMQDGQFVAELVWVPWIRLKQMEHPHGPYRNVDAIPRWTYKEALNVARSLNRLSVMGLPNFFDVQVTEQDAGFVLLEQLWCKIPPSWLDLGPSDQPEMWLFTIANREVVIQAEPVEFAHGKFPYFAIEHDPDMHSPQNPGSMELLLGLQDYMDWMFNSHIENTRKALNDMFVVDPERVHIEDLLRPQPMKIIRLRPEFYGSDVKSAIQQLQVQDVTSGHLQNLAMVFDLMQRVSGALDALMGLPSPRRRTASEAMGTLQLAASRLRVGAQLISGMGITEWGSQQLALLQQYMDAPILVKIVGSRKSAKYKEFAEGTLIHVDPEDIQGSFVLPIHDGSMPLDPVRVAQTWQQILIAVARIPILAAQFDLGKIFERAVRVLGVRNIDDFRVKTRVVPDQAVRQGVESGRYAPIEQPRGRPSDTAAEGGGAPSAVL